jgi:organic radical activating enzyme
VSEVFCSVQGEGLYLGERQLFFRTAGCSESCHWCDTVPSKSETESCTIHGAKKRVLINPLTVEQAVEESLTVVRESPTVRTVTLTGGEPLEQGEFVANVARAFKRKGLRIYLETNGLEVEGLRKLRPHTDVIAMDIKLPSATGKPLWDKHHEFLEYLTCREVFIKVVVDAETPLDEIAQAVRIIMRVDRNIPLVLQPESSAFLKGGAATKKAIRDLLLLAQRSALKHLNDVRVIPQCHKVLNVR